MSRRTINRAGAELIQSFEGLRLTAYPDPGTGGAPWTIGWGHTGPDVKPGLRITRKHAEVLFYSDLMRFEDKVNVMAPKATDNQFAALVSFAYNLGPEKLRGSTLLRLHNAGDYAGAAKQFRRWNRAGGRVLAGLTRRRLAEADLYLTP